MAEVTEQDRLAAANYMKLVRSTRWSVEGILSGGCDNTSIVQAFAAHREAAEKAERQAVVDWLNAENGLCDCFAREENECGCGAWDDYKTKPLLDIAAAIERGDHRKG